jgi:transposase
MPTSEYDKQVLRRKMIQPTTLIIGIDIGDDFHALAYINKEGTTLAQYPKIINSRQGFDQFKDITESLKAAHGCTDVLVGLEPSGHYHRNFARWAKHCGFAVRYIRPDAAKHERKLSRGSKSKNDKRDALTLANLTREGRYLDVEVEPGDKFSELRQLAHLRNQVIKLNTAAKNKLHAALDELFPELPKIFPSIDSKGFRAVLEHCPFPADVIKLDESELVKIIDEATHKKKKSIQKAQALYAAAKSSIGKSMISQADRFRFTAYFSEVKESERSLLEIEQKLIEIAKTVPRAENLLSIPGVGIKSIAVLLGELGDPTRFQSAKQIIRHAGYDPREDKSGKHGGRLVISKEGRWLMRKCLFLMILNVVQKSTFFKAFYHWRLKTKTSEGHTLKKKQALCAAILKLLRVIFALLRSGRKFEDTLSHSRSHKRYEHY